MSEYSELKLESFEFHRYNFATSNFPSFHLEDLSVQQESENREKKRGIQVSFQRKSPSRKDIDRARETGRDREGGRAWKGELPSFCAIDSPSFQGGLCGGYVKTFSRFVSLFLSDVGFCAQDLSEDGESGETEEMKTKISVLIPSLSFAFARHRYPITLFRLCSIAVSRVLYYSCNYAN